MNDEVLVGRARAGDPDAIGELYCRYSEAVHAIAVRMTRSVEDADDVLQDVFTGLPAALPRFGGGADLETWLRKVAVRWSLMVMRRKKRRREVELDARPDEAVRGEEALLDRLAVDYALGRLPEEHRLVFVLKVVEGYSHEEIGEFLGINSELSAVRLSRARKRLRDILERCA